MERSIVTLQNRRKYEQYVSSADRDNSPYCAKLLDRLSEIQWMQLKHDERYHKEITVLPVADRMKHFALHFAKYLGYFSEAIDSENSLLYERALTDAFIISVASANTLNLDLHAALKTGETGFSERGENTDLPLAPCVGEPMSFLKQVARHCGRLAKSCESLDHVEAYPFREQMASSILELFRLVVAESSVREIDLAETAKTRLDAIESKSIFHDRYSR